MMSWINLMWAKLLGAWRSWVIWFNGVGLALIEYWPDLVTNFPTIQGYVSDTVFKRTMGTILIINMILRFKTKDDLADKTKVK